MSFDKNKVEEIKQAREAWEGSCLKEDLDACGERKRINVKR
jgi:hypothetical protein